MMVNIHFMDFGLLKHTVLKVMGNHPRAKSQIMNNFQMTIERTDNGYVLSFPDEVSDNGHTFIKRIVIEDDHEDDLSSHEDVLHEVMEYFLFFGDKHKEERIGIVRHVKGKDY